ncbi:MAG: hypothetical protein ABF335_13435 [Alphaproteobacteria bacterium]
MAKDPSDGTVQVQEFPFGHLGSVRLINDLKHEAEKVENVDLAPLVEEHRKSVSAFRNAAKATKDDVKTLKQVELDALKQAAEELQDAAHKAVSGLRAHKDEKRDQLLAAKADAEAVLDGVFDHLRELADYAGGKRKEAASLISARARAYADEVKRLGQSKDSAKDGD